MNFAKLYYVVLYSILFLGSVNAQDWLWEADISCTNNSQANVFKSDNNGDLLLFMVYEGDITVKGRTISSNGSKDILLSKFSSDGDTLWNKSIGSVGSESPRRMIINELNEIIITGGFSGPIDFDGAGLVNTYSSEDIFLAKYSPDGDVLWARSIAWGPNQERSSGVVIDDGGNIGLVGFFRDSIFFENDTLISSGGIDNFFAKYDGDGNFIRAIQYPGNNNTTRLNEITLSNDNAFLLSGFFTGIFTAQTQSIVSVGATDIVLIKSDTAGAELWVRTAGSTSTDRAFNASSDQYGNVYLTGYLSGVTSFDSAAYGLRESSTIASKGSNDMFLAKYNKNGTLQWKTRNGSIGVDQGYGVQAYNNIVQFTGLISDTVIFGTDTLISKNNSEDAGFFIYNTEGVAIKGVSIQGSLDDGGADVVYDNAGNAYLAGYFSSDTLYLGDQLIIKQASGATNPFLAKYSIPFSASYTETAPIDCNGDANGGLTVTPYFGAEPFSYEWSHDAGLNDSVATNLIAGTYSVTITDARDSIAFATINLNEPASISLLSILSDASCHSTNGPSNDGSIDLTVTGGTVIGPYTYAWEAISGSGVTAINEDQTTLTMGEYRVTVTDDNLCMNDSTFLISQPDPIAFTGSIITPATGGGSDGAIDLNPSGGNDASPYSFAWSNLETTEDITGLFAGNYAVTVTDILTCEGDTSFLVNDAGEFLAYIVSKEDVDCKGNFTGEAVVGTSGGTLPYTYAWTNSGGNPIGANLAYITNVIAGTYYVTVTNSDLRTAQASVVINEPDQALLFFITPKNLDCFNDNSGVADLTVSGGTLPYDFLWSNGAITEDIVNIPASTYSVVITDNNACQEIAVVDIEQPASMDININIDQEILCFGELTGVLTATASGGTGTKSYVWDDPGNQTEQTATNLGGGTYSVIATDINLCTISDNIQLTEPALLELAETHQDISCLDMEDGIINLTPVGGSPPLNYDWSNGDISQDITDLVGGTYSVIVTDQNSCIEELADISILDAVGSSLISESVSDESCYSAYDGGIAISATNPVGNLTFSVDGSTFLDNGGVFSNLTQGNYDVWVRDGNSCEQLLTTLTVSGPDPIDLDTTVIHAVGAQGGSVVAIASGGDEPYTYFLVSDTTDESNLLGEFADLYPDDYNLFSLDNNSCSTDTLFITIIQTFDGTGAIIIYNAFSPNDDGTNDTWAIGKIDEFAECTVVVVNTWGSKVFESRGYTEPWDGTFKGSDLPGGTYYYIIDLGDGSEAYTGPVSIVR